MSRQVALEKTEEVEEIKRLIQQHNVLGVASLQKVRAAQLQELKKKLRDNVNLRVVKNTLMRRAIAECKEKPKLQELEGSLSSSNIFLFTNLNPFKLALLLERGRVKATAKAGDVAAFDVVIPAGNTGLPPGPIISQLGAVGLPTRIESGSVWINRDTLVVKKGETIDARLAGVLSKLNIKPVEVGLLLKAAYDDGLVITEEQLRIDVEATKRNLMEAQAHAFNLSLNTAYPISENIIFLLQTAHRRAFGLALDAGVFTRETIAYLLGKAHMEALSLSERLKKVEGKAEKAPSESAQKG